MAVSGPDTAAEAVARARAGLPVAPEALPGGVGHAVRLARELGAPLVPALDAAIRSGLATEELRRAVEVAAAEGRAVARGLVLAPPVLGPLAALLVADQPFAAWATTAGRTVLGVAALLWVAGALVVHAMVARALPPAVSRPTDADLLDLVAIALDAGLALPAAVRRAAAHLGREEDGAALALWLELGGRGRPPAQWDEFGPVLHRALCDGAPQAGLARSLAGATRRATHHSAMQRAARLGTRLALPTTLLLLPAAGLVVAVPLVHAAVAVAA